MEFKDYHEKIVVYPSADLKIIKNAHLHLADWSHPAVSHEKHTERKLKKFPAAHKVLKDGKRCSEYDLLNLHCNNSYFSWQTCNSAW